MKSGGKHAFYGVYCLTYKHLSVTPVGKTDTAGVPSSDMSRDRTRTKDHSGGSTTGSDIETDFEVGLDEESESSAETDASGLRQRVGIRAKSIFSPRMFIAALLLAAVGLFTATTFVPLPGAGVLGVFVATFLFGLVVPESRYAEATVAGGTVTAASVFLDFAVVAFLGGFGPSLALLGAAVGGVVGAVGNYFGRDLRDGLTRDIDQ